MVKYELQVWDKNMKKYITTWEGKDFVMAQILAAKPYNNLSWMGKKRIVRIITTVELELRHLNNK